MSDLSRLKENVKTVFFQNERTVEIVLRFRKKSEVMRTKTISIVPKMHAKP